MNRLLLIAPLLLVVSLAGCQRGTPAAPEAAVAPSIAASTPPAPATAGRGLATSDLAGAGVQPNAAGFSSKDFAGTFTGTLPCADCPGIDETLELKPDGSFVLTDVYRERPSATQSLAGSWNAEAGDTRLRLDPNSKGADDRVFAITGKDALDALGSDGKPVPGPTQQLKRRNQ